MRAAARGSPFSVPWESRTHGRPDVRTTVGGRRDSVMAYTLPDLPYPENALEPHIDAQTMNIHRTKHHQAYINNVNKALEKHPNLANKPIEQLMRELSSVPEDIRTA